MDTLETRSMGGFMSLHSNNKASDIVTTHLMFHVSAMKFRGYTRIDIFFYHAVFLSSQHLSLRLQKN